MRTRLAAPLFRRRGPVVPGDCPRCKHANDAHSRVLGCMIGWLPGHRGCGCEVNS